MTTMNLLIEGGLPVTIREGEEPIFGSEPHGANGKTYIPPDEGRIFFTPGEKILLFIGRTNEGDYVPFAGAYGKYIINSDNMVTSNEDISMSLNELKNEIHEAIKDPSRKSFQPFVRFEQYLIAYTLQAENIVIGDVDSVSESGAGITINQVLKGSLAGNYVKVDKPSKEDANMDSYTLTFIKGEKVLLFLRKTERSDYEVTPGPHGKFTIEDNQNSVSNSGYKIMLNELKKKIQDILKNPTIKH